AIPAWIVIALHHDIGATPRMAMLVPLVFLDTQKWLAPNGRERIAFWQAIGTGVFGCILASIFHGDQMLTMSSLIGTCLLAQILSPWDPAAAIAQPYTCRPRRGLVPEAAPFPAGAVAREAPLRDVSPAAPISPLAYSAGASFGPPRRFVPRWAPIAWMFGTVACLTTGLMLIIAANTLHFRNEEDIVMVAFGVPLLILSAFCLWRSFVRTYRSIWSYLIRPLLMVLLVVTAISSAIVIGNMHLHDDETMVGIFFIIFPSVLFLSLLIAPKLMAAQRAEAVVMPPGVSPHKRLWAALLTAPGFVGFAGL